jgi:hypothetical protein
LCSGAPLKTRRAANFTMEIGCGDKRVMKSRARDFAVSVTFTT